MTDIKWSVEQPFQALALTGGGFRGLFAAQALQCMEEHIGHPIGRHFDLTCGTSIGGIVALAVAFEVPMKKVVDVFADLGPTIFPPHTPPEGKWQIGCDLFKHRNKPRYLSASLREAIASLIPDDAILGDALHPVAIPAVNVTEGRPQVFKTRHKSEWHRDWKLKAIDVALATSAAPTFFELAEVSGSLYSDGGLFANAPDLIAFHEAEHYFGARRCSPDSQHWHYDKKLFDFVQSWSGVWCCRLDAGGTPFLGNDLRTTAIRGSVNGSSTR